MPILVPLPRRPGLQLEHLLIDVNGTLTVDGQLIAGVQERLAQLRERIDIRLLSADTLGTVPDVARQLGGLTFQRISTGSEKEAHANHLGAQTCVAVGNGANDEKLLRAAALGITVIGPEGAAPNTIASADITTTSILDALDLLLHPARLTATLRD